MRRLLALILACALTPVIGLLPACGGGSGSTDAAATATAASGVEVDLKSTSLANPLAYIPSQCFTRTVDDAGRAHNPCFACHVASQEPNYLDDGGLQQRYDFPGDTGAVITNPWTNLFRDRAAALDAMGDSAILAWVRQDNYLKDGHPVLAHTLTRTLPPAWDVNGDGRWDGYIPDARFAFDAQGFDRTADGGYSGWRAFAYAPFLGTFWPTNGATDDVLIRLAPALRQNEAGGFDLTAYRVNLAIVTALIQRRNVALETPADETAWQVDLDQDGRLSTAHQVVFDWAPLQGKLMHYVGRARLEQQAGRLHLAAGLFPEGTEFLHSVRYLDMDETGGIRLAARMKELRYAIKKSWYSYSDLREMALKEAKEKAVSPERTRQFSGSAEVGLANGQGWTYQGYIEDRSGTLRPQSFEETAFCIGCHSGIGATTDGVFAFPRKFGDASFRNSWYHWSQKDLTGVPDPMRRDGKPEYTHYLEQNGAGDEFRENSEVMSTFFNADGSLKPEAVARLRADVTTLLNPTRERALMLNKAYRLIVSEQSYAQGRDPTRTPARNVLRTVDQGRETGIATPITGP